MTKEPFDIEAKFACIKCGVIKNKSEFEKRKECVNGVFLRCKSCLRKHRLETLERIKICIKCKKFPHAKSTLWCKKCNAKYQRKWHKANAYRGKARNAVKLAVRNGLLTKPFECNHCKSLSKLDAHHPNGYENALDISWLCRPCHVKDHQRMRAEKSKEVSGKEGT